ncbi:MAG: hypothetical protein LC708_02990, partial [Actinobacteria bacterium]|nr:hypothetical protein [Actinomycetota bacterium]
MAADLGVEDAVARRDLGAERDAAMAEGAALAEERARWAEGGLVDPDGPPWRTPRDGRAGAPLWRLVDVAPGVEAADVDGLEAALTGAGLLDAWVQPDGTVDLGDGRADVGLGVRPAAGATLADRLVVVGNRDSGVPDAVVERVLASVAVVATAGADPAGGGPDVVVATDGSFRLGAAAGRGPRRPALLLGAVARERHRLARLAEIDAALAAVTARLADLDRRQADLDRRRAAVAAELAAAPSGAPVDDARRAVDAAAARLAEAEARLDAARAALTLAEGVVREALRALTALAARHSLPSDVEGLAAVEAGLRRLAQAAATWARRRRDLQGAEIHHTRAAERLAAGERLSARAAADRRDAEREVVAVEGRVAGLESSLGAGYGELLRRLAALDEERGGAQRRGRELAEKAPELERRVGRLRAELEAAAAERATAEDERAGAHARYGAVLAAVGPDAGLEPAGALDAASAVLASARAVAAAHESVDADGRAVERLSER